MNGITANKLQPIRFGEYLFERQLITEEQLLATLGDHWSNGGRVGEAIVRLGFLDPREIEEQAAAYHRLDVIEVSS